MVSGAGRRAVVAAGVLAAAGAGAAVIAVADEPTANTTQAKGGLAVSPSGLERTLAVGATHAMTVTNNSDETLDVAVNARPWTQSQSGAVSPNRRSTLSQMSVSDGEFSLAPGESKPVSVTLRGAPRGGSLYGALEIIGLPEDVAERKGIVTGYRLVGAIRLHPAQKSYSLKAGSAKLNAKKMITLPIRSTGNTNDAVSGTVRVRGPLGTRQGSVKSTRILPGKSVAIALVSAKKLPAGSYTATVTLKQGSLRTTVTKKLRVKR